MFFLDLSNVLLIEPSNTSAQEEMKKVTTLIQQEKAKVVLYFRALHAFELTKHYYRNLKLQHRSSRLLWILQLCQHDDVFLLRS